MRRILSLHKISLCVEPGAGVVPPAAVPNDLKNNLTILRKNLTILELQNCFLNKF